MAENEEELKSLLMRVKEEGEKAGLKLNIQKIKIMASGCINSWQIKREKVEAVTDFIFLGSQITAGNDCSHEIKRCLLLGRKAMTNLDSILKNRDIILSMNVHIFKAMIFSVVMYWCESWIINKAEHWRIDAFKVVLEKTLESPLDSKEIKPVNPKGNHPWVFTGRTYAEGEAPVLWPPDAKSWLTGKNPDMGNNWMQKEKRVAENEMFRQHHRLDGHEFVQILGDSEGRGAWCAAAHGVTKSQTWLSDWTAATILSSGVSLCKIPIFIF